MERRGIDMKYIVETRDEEIIEVFYDYDDREEWCNEHCEFSWDGKRAYYKADGAEYAERVFWREEV